MAQAGAMQQLLRMVQRSIASTLSKSSLPIIIGATIVSALLVGALWLLSSWLISWMLNGTIISWDWFMVMLQGAAAFVLVWGLFPLLIPLFISMFVNQLAASIEKREYADQPQGKDLPYTAELRMDIGFVFYAVLLNILVLPIYLIPGVNLIIYYILNAHLLGKQYYMMITRRHIPKSEIKPNMRPHRSKIYLYGLLIVLCSTIPVVNLLAPAFATAIMVHAFFALRT